MPANQAPCAEISMSLYILTGEPCLGHKPAIFLLFCDNGNVGLLARVQEDSDSYTNCIVF